MLKLDLRPVGLLQNRFRPPPEKRKNTKNAKENGHETLFFEPFFLFSRRVSFFEEADICPDNEYPLT